MKMATAKDIAAHILTASLDTGKSDEDHGADLARLVGGWVEFGALDITDGVMFAKNRVTNEVRFWMHRVLFEASLVTPGARGRALSSAAEAVLA